MPTKTLLTVLLMALSLLGGCTATPAGNISPSHVQVGYASFYGHEWQGRKTANGERLDLSAMTAAHKTLPFGTRVRVTLLSTGRSIVVRINDRGPFVRGRIIDLTDGAARKLGLNARMGIGKVRLEVLK